MKRMPQIATRQYIAQERDVFYCSCRIKIPFGYSEALLEDCFNILHRIDLMYNSYQKNSFFDLINRYAGQWVEVDDQCISILKPLKLISEITDGSYDITCMPLIKLWGFYRNAHETLPTQKDLTQVLQKVDYRSIAIDGNHVKIDRGQELITASFIKAYAVDRVTEFLRANGVNDAIINAGGSTIMCINDEYHEYWKINVPDPLSRGSYNARLLVNNQCFSLSGMQNNQIVIKGKTYGHILNSRTGQPATTLQVGTLSKQAFLGDMLSTALFTVDSQKLTQTINRLKQHFEFDYFRIEEDGSKSSDKCF